MGLITHKSLAQFDRDRTGTCLREGSISQMLPGPQVSQQTVGFVELLVMVVPAWKDWKPPSPYPGSSLRPPEAQYRGPHREEGPL